MKEENFTFLCRTKIGFGMNALEHLPFDLSAMGAQKPLVLQDKSSRLVGLAKPLARAFKESGMTLGIWPSVDAARKTEVETLKKLYQIFTEKGFDCIIVLGTGPVTDLAKALNMAVSLGPEAFRNGLDSIGVKSSLIPWAYVPTGVGTGMETGKTARFNGRTHVSQSLAPDLAVIDPVMLISDDFFTLVNAALTCLSACCEAFVLSKNPLARAYSATGITLVMENLLPLLNRLDSSARADGKASRQNLARLVHASVVTGYILANCEHLLSVRLGRAVAGQSRATPGQAMAVFLPVVLDFFARGTLDLGNLLLPLYGPEKFSAVPAPQRPGRVVQTIQGLVNELYRMSGGRVPRTLADTELDKNDLAALVQSRPAEIQDSEQKSMEIILAHAFDGRPLEG